MSRFHEHIKHQLFKGSLPDWQREPVDAMVREGIRRKRSKEEVAYALATAYWESGRFKYKE